MKIDIDRVETVTPNTLIGDMVLFHPETAELLFSIGMHCLGCPSSGVETVSDAASVHGLDADDLVRKLNHIIKN
jgi:hybrid cluster-associated redox disulfide protein